MNRNIILVGKAATGKDTILNKIISKSNFKTIISYTTRPIREGETEGLDYFYVNDDIFDNLKNNNKFVETTSYKVIDKLYRYGLPRNQFENEENHIMILNPRGINEVLNNLKNINFEVYLLYVGEEKRKQRYLDRESDPLKYQKLEERIKQDNIDFKNFKFPITKIYVNDTYNDLEEIVNEIIKGE